MVKIEPNLLLLTYNAYHAAKCSGLRGGTNLHISYPHECTEPLLEV